MSVRAGDVQENLLESADVRSQLVGISVFGPVFGHGDEAVANVIPRFEYGFARSFSFFRGGVLRADYGCACAGEHNQRDEEEYGARNVSHVGTPSVDCPRCAPQMPVAYLGI